MVPAAIHFKSPGITFPTAYTGPGLDAQKILQQATGWFITHGGFNSVTESLASGIPL